MIRSGSAANKAARPESNGQLPTVEALAGVKRLAATFLQELGLYDVATGVAMPYYGLTGEELFIQERRAMEGKHRFYQPAGVKLQAYGQWRLDEAAKAGFLIVPAGESNCWALWYRGVPALGLPGSNAGATLERDHVAAVQTVYIHRDPDQGGDAFVRGVAQRLDALSYQGKAFELRMPDGIKDPADLHVQHPEPDAFHAALAACIKAAKPIRISQDDNAFDLWEPTIPLNILPAVADFPTEVYPQALRRFAEDAAKAVGCPVDYLAVPMLAVAGGAIGASKAVEIKKRYIQRSLIYNDPRYS